MYPFFSGLGGFVFGDEQGRQPRSVEHRRREQEVPEERAADRQVEQGRPDQLEARLHGRAERLPEEAAAFWITGPWNIDTLQKSGLKFKIIQVPKIVYPSVPFLGVQGVMVRKYATVHGVGLGREGLRHNFLATPAAQNELAAANGRPRRTSRRQGVTTRSSRVRRGQQGWRSDAEHPADVERLERPRPGVGPLDEGRRRDAGRVARSRARPARSPTRSASATRGGGRPRGARPLDPSLSARDADTRNAPRPRTVFHHGACSRARSPPSRAASGYTIKLAFLCLTNALAVWAVYVLIAHEPLDRRRRPRRRDRADRLRLPDPAQLDAAGEVPGAGNGVPDRHSRSSRSSTRSPSHSRTTRRGTSFEAQAIAAIKVNSLQPPANGRQYDDGAGARRARPARHALARRHERKVYVGTTAGPDTTAEGRRDSQRRRQPPRRRATSSSRAPSSSPSTSSCRASRSRVTATRRFSRRAFSSAIELEADASLRRDTRSVRPDQRRARLQQQRPRLVRRRQRQEKRAPTGLEDRASGSTTSPRSCAIR